MQNVGLNCSAPNINVYCIAGNIRGVLVLFFSFSIYQNENLPHETYITMGVLSCVKWTEWTPRKFPAIW